MKNFIVHMHVRRTLEGGIQVPFQAEDAEELREWVDSASNPKLESLIESAIENLNSGGSDDVDEIDIQEIVA